MKIRKVLSQLCWIAAVGGARSVWHAVGGGVAAGFAVAGLLLAGIIAATVLWPSKPKPEPEDGQRRELLARLAADMRQAAER